MKRTIGLVGSALVIFGVFMPAAMVPLLGTITLYMNGSGDGMFILCTAVPAMLLFALNWYRVGTAFGMVTAAMVLLKMVVLVQQLQQLGQQAMADTPSNLREVIAQTVVPNAGLSWAWFILIPGALMMAFAGFVPNKQIAVKPASAAVPVEPTL